MINKQSTGDWRERQIEFWNERARGGKGTGSVPFRELEYHFIIAWTAGKKVLDTGCGQGEVMDRIASQYRDIEIVGIDISPEMVKIARERHSEVQKMDITELTFESDAFDTAIAVRVVKNILDSESQEVAMSELARVSKKRVILIDSITESGVTAPSFNLYLSREKIKKTFLAAGFCLTWEEYFRSRWLKWPIISTSRSPQNGSDEGFFVFDKGNPGPSNSFLWRCKEFKLAVSSTLSLPYKLAKRLLGD